MAAEETPIPESHSCDAHAKERSAARNQVRTPPLLQVQNLRVEFSRRSTSMFRRGEKFAAVNKVSFHVDSGETLALVGESGSGKSTTARAVLNLIRPDSGSVTLDGVRVDGLSHTRMRPHRRKVQMVFQDPTSSLNPRMTVAEILMEPLKIFRLGERESWQKEAAKLLELVRLNANDLVRWPHEFSGGQKQRIAIARALAVRPQLLVCDEPTSSLDVSVQAQIVNLFLTLRQELGLAYLFITHDLALARHLAHRTAIMRAGEIVELRSTEELFASPKHAYTKDLLSNAKGTRG
ncbi:MAG: ATP-binding cassette domain-containing protein [Pirellulales bacterium]|nr:ATP-binding cassette domain-containing protein [Pirellulales bacterium]